MERKTTPEEKTPANKPSAPKTEVKNQGDSSEKVVTEKTVDNKDNKE